MPHDLEKSLRAEVQHYQHQQRTVLTKRIGFGVLAAISTGLIYWSCDQQVPLPSAQPLAQPLPEVTKPSFPPVPMPKSGEIRSDARQQVEPSRYGELRIFLSPPTSADQSTIPNDCPGGMLISNEQHHFIKLVDWTSNQTVLTAFIRAGEKTVLKVPPGTYKLRYASGEQWYGEKHLFGEKTRYGELTEKSLIAPLKFDFTADGAGWDLGLYRCGSDGNSSTKEIKAQEF